MRKLPVLIFICLSISTSRQKKSMFYYLINTFTSLVLISQANLHGHARLPRTCSVFYHLRIVWAVLSPTRHALRQAKLRAMAGVQPMRLGLMEENLNGAVEIMDGITVTQKKNLRSSRKRSHLAANMVREGLTNHFFEDQPKSQNTK